MRLIKIFMLVTTIGLNPLQIEAQQLTAEDQVLFIYGDFYPEQISGYDLIVLEGAHFSTDDIARLKEQNGKILGYISLGEVNEAAPHFLRLKDETLGKNKIWNSYILDIGNEETVQALTEIFEHNMDKGLDGMFLDNIDNYTQFGPTPGKKPELIEFLKSIKEEYPDIYLLQNAGIPIVEDTSAFIDGIVKESIATNYNFEKMEYQLRSETEFRSLLSDLELIQEQYELPVILIEYAEELAMKAEVEKRLEPTAWPIFIGRIDLQTIPERD